MPTSAESTLYFSIVLNMVLSSTWRLKYIDTALSFTVANVNVSCGLRN